MKGCDECNRTEPKPWPIFIVNYHGVEVCAKCLTPIAAVKRPPEALAAWEQE